MVTDLDRMIKACTETCKSYRLDRISNDGEYRLTFQIERMPGRHHVPVTFDLLRKEDLVANGFEVPQ